MFFFFFLEGGERLYPDTNSDINPEFPVWSCGFDTDFCGITKTGDWARENKYYSGKYGPLNVPYGAKGTGKIEHSLCVSKYLHQGS